MDKEHIFKAYIVNTGEYDNGNKETSGAWLYFPTTQNEVAALFEMIGLSRNASSGEYFIDDYVCDNEDIKNVLSVSDSIDELNYLANRIDELEDIELTVFQTVLQMDNECNDIRETINVTYNTEYYKIIADMSCWENVGAYFAEQAGFSVGVIGELADYIDYEAYGKDQASKNGGELVDDIYIESGCADWTDVYDGNEMNIPREYAVTPRLAAELEHIPQKDMYGIFQLKDTPELKFHHFEPLDRLHKNGNSVKYGNYNLIYLAELKAGETPETLFEKFNTDIPKDFKGHSMSVSDILVLRQNGQEQALYCDRVGFREVPEFLSGKANVLDTAKRKGNQLTNKIDKRFFKIDCDNETHIFTNVENVDDNKYIANAVSESGKVAGYYSTLFQSEIDKAVISDNIKDLIDTEKTKSNTITVLIVQPAQEPYTKEIGADLKSLQQVVGGKIEVIYPFADEVGIICNDEGKNERLELNRALYDAEGEIYDIIAGTFFVAGIDSENFCSLSPEQIKTYSERFKSPEMFIQVNDNIKAIPVKPSIKRELKKLSSEKLESEPKQKQKKPPNTELSEP